MYVYAVTLLFNNRFGCDWACILVIPRAQPASEKYCASLWTNYKCYTFYFQYCTICSTSLSHLKFSIIRFESCWKPSLSIFTRISARPNWQMDRQKKRIHKHHSTILETVWIRINLIIIFSCYFFRQFLFKPQKYFIEYVQSHH